MLRTKKANPKPIRLTRGHGGFAAEAMKQMREITRNTTATVIWHLDRLDASFRQDAVKAVVTPLIHPRMFPAALTLTRLALVGRWLGADVAD
jgi:hypothetical protein